MPRSGIDRMVFSFLARALEKIIAGLPASLPLSASQAVVGKVRFHRSKARAQVPVIGAQLVLTSGTNLPLGQPKHTMPAARLRRFRMAAGP